MKKLHLDGFSHPSLSYGFYTRHGGVSTGIYASLNCAEHSGDVPENIQENRRRVLDDLGGADISTLKQIHSPLCHIIDDKSVPYTVEGDALVTRTAGQVIGVLTADCGPVLFYAEDKTGSPVIGAAHAGWGGALKGVLESTIASMKELGANMGTIHAAIGPCIGPQSYEVGHDFSAPFIAEDSHAKDFFHTKKGDNPYFDLPAYIAYRLRRAGITHIAHAHQDTYTLAQDYFSFRRATHAGEKDYGRQISAIMIRSH